MASPVNIEAVAASKPKREKARGSARGSGSNSAGRQKQSFGLFLSILPLLVLVFLFSYFPLYGWVYALFDYKPALGIGGSEFVGLQWFEMLVSSPQQVKEIVRVVTNTLAMSFLGIGASVLPLAFAVFLNEIRATWFKNIVQTITTLPNFISWVLVYMIAFSMFSTTGLVNSVLEGAGWISAPLSFLDSPDHVWLKMTFWGIWKTVGWGAILYLASIASIDQALYESAKVDGANRFQTMWHITVPQLMPTFFVLLILAIANILNNGMEQYFVFSNAFNKSSIEVLDLYVYNIGLGGASLSMATAISMLKSVISVTLLLFVNALAKKFRGQSLI